MIKESLEKEVVMIYDATKALFDSEIEAMEAYITQRTETADLQDISDEEMLELLPDISEDIVKMRKAGEMLADEEVREKWIALVQSNLLSEITEEDLKTLEAAALIEERIEKVFQSGSEILVAWVHKESDDQVVVQ